MAELDKNNQLAEMMFKEVSRFSEWRGAVKETLKHLADAMDRREKQEDNIFTLIKDVQNDQKTCRERCDSVACTKAGKDDVDNLKKSQSDQEKLQIKQQVTLGFYGLIGGAVFTMLMAIFNFILKFVER